MNLALLKPDTAIKVASEIYHVRSTLALEEDNSDLKLITLENRTREYQLAATVQNITTEERKKAGEQIDQALGTELNTLIGNLEEFTQQFPDHPAQEFIQHLEALVQHCDQHGRALVEPQLTAFPSSESLLQELRGVAEEYREVFHFEIAIEGRDLPDLDSDRQRGELYLILKEALRNAYRHSGGDRATLLLSTARIEVEDNGAGLYKHPDSGSSGIGCRSMAARASSLGFQMNMLLAPRNGWCLNREES
jgi:signal transduction histidine kinase